MAIEFPKLYVLAGGRSSRFGGDKARVVVEGAPMIVRIVRSLERCTRDATVVAAAADQYQDLGLRTIGDFTPGAGPMAGLQAAMRDCAEGSWVLLVSCDFAAADESLVRPLIAAATGSERAIAYRHAHWEPLLALYHASLKEEVDCRIAAGRRAMQALLDEVGAVAINPPPNWPQVTQVNTPADLAAFLAAKQHAAEGFEKSGRRGAMQYQVLLFGPAAEAVGKKNAQVELPSNARTVVDLRAAIARAYPALDRFLPASRLAVNHEFAAEDRVLEPGDEIALIGMVSGG